MMYRKPENSSFFSGEFCRTPGGLGLISDLRSSDGFVSCTESLGSESSNEIITDQELAEGGRGNEIGDSSPVPVKTRRLVELPPPMTSLDRNGHRSFVLRAVRKDGRLRLTEVDIRRPEIMYAIRENGRLTLRLIETPDEGEQDQEGEIEEGDEERREETGEEMEGGGEGYDCKSPARGGEGEKLRRCYEYEVAGHHHLNVWSPRVVTTM